MLFFFSTINCEKIKNFKKKLSAIMENCVGLSSCEEGEDEVLDVRIKVEIMHKHVECRYKTAATYTTLHCTVLHCTLHSAAVI